MKTYLATAAALAMLASPACADNKPVQLPTAADYQAATQQIVTRYIEAQGWCLRAKPAPKSGQVVIYYVRDAAGRCVPTFTQGK